AAWDQRILQRDEEDKVHSSTDPSKQTLHLPPRNPYIPSRLLRHIRNAEGGDKENVASTQDKHGDDDGRVAKRLRPDAAESGEQVTEELDVRPVPEMLAEDIMLAWARPSNVQRPKACLYISLAAAKASTQSFEEVVFLDLLLVCLVDLSTELAYMAEMAELHSEVLDFQGSALVLRVEGFSDQICTLMRDLIRPLFSNISHSGSGNIFGKDRLIRCAELLRERYANIDLTSSQLVRQILSAVTVSTRYLAKDKHVILQSLAAKTPEELNNRLQQWRLGLQVRCLAYGDVQAEEVKALLAEEIVKPLNKSSISASKSNGNAEASLLLSPLLKVNILPERTVRILHARPRSTKEKNAAVMCSFCLGPYDTKAALALYLLELLLVEPFFDELRTKQQLGYEVSCRTDEVQQQLSLGLKVVSSKASAAELLRRILHFIAADLPSLLQAAAGKGELRSKYLVSLQQSLEQPALTLREAAGRYWVRILDSSLAFDRREAEKSMSRQWLLEEAEGGMSELQLLGMLQELAQKALLTQPRLTVSVASVEVTDQLRDVFRDQNYNYSILLQ
ncbi:hypothetical protein EON64_14255, partial [archaeon]